MTLNDKQKQRVEGIIGYLNLLLDKRFAQACRVNPRLESVEADIRWHQLETMRQLLESSKGFGPLKLVVGDILCSADEQKKRDLFNPMDQVSLMNEVIPTEDEGASKERRVGQLEIRNIKSFYKALDPMLEKITLLVQTWIWWDLRDAADLYRFDLQELRLQNLRAREMDSNLEDVYRREMAAPPSDEITKDAVMKFEMGRTKEILDRFERARAEEAGYQVIVVGEELGGSAEADGACLRLAKRLVAIEKLRIQKESLEDAVRAYYAQHLNLPSESVTVQMILDYEEGLARRERHALSDALSASCKLGKAGNFKRQLAESMRARFEALLAALGLTEQALAAVPPPEAKAEKKPESKVLEML